MIVLVVLLVVLVLLAAVLVWRMLRIVVGTAPDGAGTVPLRRAADRVEPPGNLGPMSDAKAPTHEPTVPDAGPSGGAA